MILEKLGPMVYCICLHELGPLLKALYYYRRSYVDDDDDDDEDDEN